MKAAMILPHLLLPKTKSETNGSDSKTLSRRIILWKQSLLDELFTEAKALQIRHPKQKKSEVNEEVKQFDKLMSTGKISAAIGCLSDKTTKGVLPLNEVIEGKTVLSILKEKHPQAKTANTNYITEVSEDTMPYHPSIFEQINAKTVRKSTLKTHGSQGPSGLDACEWKRILTHFNETSIELCKNIAKLSYTIATKVLPQENLTAYISCRLIPLVKNPGVRLIGIGEILRRIAGRTITQCIKPDLKILGKNFQLCLGHKYGIEYALKKVEILCPALHHALANSYKHPLNLYVNNTVLTSPEGTPQDDPFAMAIYVIGIIRLIELLQKPNVT